MNVLLIGSGGREHALAWALCASPSLTRLYAAPGNPGIAQLAICVDVAIDDHAGLIALCRDKMIDLVVVGPEAPLVAGLVDELQAAGVLAFGPGRAAAQLEGSKGFTKDLCREAGIPTAAYGRFSDKSAALAYLRNCAMPIVVKADGLAAGKGVTVATSYDEAAAAISACFAGTFGAAGGEVVIEDFMEGEEVSFFVLSDGKSILPFGSAQDHKRVGDGDTGPNTGGMGAYAPAPVFTPDLEAAALETIIRPAIAAMAARGMPFRGVLFAGLMLTGDGPKLIEFNCRFGDPETEVLMRLLKDDLLLLLHAAASGTLASMSARWHKGAAMTVVLAAKGYPDAPQKGGIIRNLEQAAALDGVEIFHAGTAISAGHLVASGGRVLNVTSTAPTLPEARALAYAAVDLIDFKDGFCRRDIGHRAINQD
ncbi:phosphoribosylamine--glycine ligase [Candidatus Raskinella chloraquaticus]|uniref:Phosphoribosylamine--glycine ligase n=1 Tax=Candidatus Raskinella chloraquaticus TaxID=1951219 RepID=A0A1W9HWI3_9HYPH|nr:MAG: phosphoribosylamine--glycine ligase [Proteobacteria bacterium SG_bin8]